MAGRNSVTKDEEKVEALNAFCASVFKGGYPQGNW